MTESFTVSKLQEKISKVTELGNKLSLRVMDKKKESSHATKGSAVNARRAAANLIQLLKGLRQPGPPTAKYSHHML